MSTSVSAVNQLLALAKDRFGDDFDSGGTGVDTKFFTAAADGNYADYSDPKGGKDAKHPAKAKDWGSERALQASRIEWLCTDKAAAALVSRKGIQIRGARIDGTLDLSEVRFDRSIMLAYCALVKRPDFSDASFVALYLSGTHCPGLFAQRLRLEGDLHLRDGFLASRDVSLDGASIGGRLDCSGGSFLKKDVMALRANAITVTGDVFLRGEFRANGEVHLAGASIGGQLDCSAGSFLNEGGTALDANAITVTEDVFLRAGIVEGKVNQLVMFRVEGGLDFTRANITGSLQYRQVSEPKKALLYLGHAKVGVLWDDPEGWPDPGNLWLRGFEYEALGYKATVDAAQRIDWLSRDGGDGFSPQPYEQLAKVLSRSGHRSEALAIRVEKERCLARQERERRLEKQKQERERLQKNHERERVLDRLRNGIFDTALRCWNFFYSGLTDFGYRPWKVLPWSILIVVVGLPLYEVGYHQGWITPTRVESQVAPYKGGGAIYPTFQGLAYSIDVFVPLVNIEQVDYWLPNAARGPHWDWPLGYYVSCSGVLLFFYYCQVISGWILTTLLVVGLTRLVQRED